MSIVSEEKVTKRCKRYNFPNNAHELTFSCYRSRPFLKNKTVCQKLADVLNDAGRRHDFAVWAYVFMPEHIHLLIWPRGSEYSISKILKAVKQPLSRWVLAFHKKHQTRQLEQMATGQAKQAYRFWQNGGGYDRNIIKRDTAINSMHYIHYNPVRRKLVKIPGDWYYSSYNDWKKNIEGPVFVDRLSFWH